MLDTIYLGGGTPSILPESALKQLFKAIHKEYHLARDCEITVEVNPDSVTPSLLRTLRHGGVNRISMGVQSAHDQELSLLNRLHTFEQAEQAVKLIRKAGFKNLNLDLIFGLPDQTMAAWQESVEAILALEPEHISMYALTLEEGVQRVLRLREDGMKMKEAVRTVAAQTELNKNDLYEAVLQAER